MTQQQIDIEEEKQSVTPVSKKGKRHTNVSIGDAFFSGDESGKTNSMEIYDAGDKTLLVGYGWAVYSMRDKATGFVTFFKGWDGYSSTTSKQLTQTGIRGMNQIEIDERPELTGFDARKYEEKPKPSNPFTSKKAQMPMAMTKTRKLGSKGSGWFKESARHSEARYKGMK